MRKYNRFFIVCFVSIASLLGFNIDAFGQEDTEFWLAVPRMLSTHNQVKKAAYHLIVFNPNSETAHISISQPANKASGNINTTMSVDPGQMKYETLAGTTRMSPNADTVSVPFDVISQRGLYITSDLPVECYFQITKGNGEVYTLKGQNALGYDFVVAMQNKFNNGTKSDNEMYENAFSSVAIVATEDNTAISITPTQNISPSCNKSKITKTLNRGETYAFRACGSEGSKHPIASVITSDKPIAVTYCDDSALSGNGADAIGEQLVPTSLAGDRYVAISNKSKVDYLFLIGLENGTTITDHEGNTYSLNQGEVKQVSLSDKPAIYLEGNNPFEVFQVTGVAKKSGSSDHELGGTVLPQVSCTGSKAVSYGRIYDNLILNIVTRNTNTNALSVNGQTISSSNFTALGSSGYSYLSANIKDIADITNENITVVSSGDVFQIGILDYKSGETATYGYFSSYTTSADVMINGEQADKYTICRNSALNITVNSSDKNVDLSKATVRWYLLKDNKLVLQPHMTSNSVTIPAFDVEGDQAVYVVQWEGECGISSKRITLDILDCIPLAEHPFRTGDCDITVAFAPGNLQYQASTDTWRFAKYQWEAIGATNTNISPTYSGWIDLFGWATGNNPTNTSTDDLSYGGTTEISGTEYDWGKNTISNSDGAEWHSLTYEEWQYILTSRPRADELKGGATVNGVKGAVILPDDWVMPTDVTAFKPEANCQYNSNTYTANEWAKMQQAGAVFLPVTGTRNLSGQFTSQDNGYYWTGSPSDKDRINNYNNTRIDKSQLAYDFYFSEGEGIDYFRGNRAYGDAVRLVKYINETPHVGLGEETVETCEGSYTWPLNGVTYTKSDNYQITVVNPENKCDSIVVLHLTVNKNEELEPEVITECDQYTWAEDGKIYTESGTYTHESKTDKGCKRTATLKLTINHSEVVPPLKITECDQYTWAEDGKTYTESGTYTHESETAEGCKRTATLKLTINKSEVVQQLEVTECDQYTWAENGQTYTESGTYTHESTTDKGCKRTATLKLTINKSEVVPPLEVTECDQYTWAENGQTYTESGTYTHESTTDKGCKRTATLKLTINKSEVAEPEVVTECDQYTWAENGQTYTESGTYTHESETAEGCKRTATLKLTINKSEVAEPEVVTECDQYTWAENGQTYTQSGTYTHESETAEGCKRTATLNLTIKESPVVEVYDSICKNESYPWGEMNYTRPGRYSKHEISKLPPYCDSTVILNLAYYPSFEHDAPEVTACDEYEWEGTKYTKSGRYTKTLQTIHGCDSIVTLPLTINYTKDTLITDSICFGESYIISDTPYNKSGYYTETLTSKNGCDSTVNLILTVLPQRDTTIDVTICKEYSYAVYDIFGNHARDAYFSEPGRHVAHITSYEGCDSTVIVNIANFSSPDIEVHDEICEGDIYMRNGKSYTQAGDYPETLFTADGCSYIETLHLTVHPIFTNVHIFDTICSNQYFTWEGSTYTQTTNESKNLHTIHGCDSIVTLHLQVWQSYDNIFDYRELCEGEPFHWGDINIPSVKASDSGKYTYTFQSIHGCDSVVTMTLQVNSVFRKSFDVTICDNESYTWEETTYTFNGKRDVSDTKTLSSRHGCDSIVTINIRFNETKQSSFDATICDNETFEWNGTTYNTAGAHTQTLHTYQGCDSVVTLNLKVNPTYDTHWADTITIGTSFEWAGSTYYDAGTYTKEFKSVSGCDSIVTLQLNHNIVDIHDIDYSDYCLEKDSAINLTIHITGGYIEYVQLYFSENAHEQGIKDRRVNINGSHEPIVVNIPSTARADNYQLQADYYFRGKVVYTQYITFKVLYPASVLLQKWNDFIGVQTFDYNGGYNFVAFEWYKDGELIVGQTGSYIYQPLEPGASYTALLTDDEGNRMFTCPLIAENKDEIGLYPTVVKKMGKMQLHVTQPARCLTYDTTGKLISQSDYPTGDTTIQAPQQSGVYIMRIILNDNQTERTYKVVVGN